MLAGKGRQRQGHHLTLLDLQQTGGARAHPEQAVFILGQTHDFNLDPEGNRQQPLPGPAHFTTCSRSPKLVASCPRCMSSVHWSCSARRRSSPSSSKGSIRDCTSPWPISPVTFSRSFA